MTGDRRVAAAAAASVLVAALLAGGSLLRPGFYDSHDGLLNVHRVFQLEKCLADGQIPCRWVPDMGAGYGYPLFNFYPPLASFVAEGFRVLGAPLLSAVKWSFLLALVVSGLGMFALARRFFGPAGAALAGVLYVLAPYQAVDVFVRGALAETWGMALLPLVFHAGLRSVSEPGRALRHALPCALAWAALLLAHDVTALMVAPVYALWLGAAWRVRRGSLLPAVLGHALALGLSAFFVLPLLVELRHVHADTLTSLQPWGRFENNFLDVRQLLLAPHPWGYGAVGSPDAMSLFIGRLHFLLGAGAVVAAGARLARERRLDEAAAAALVLGGSGLAAAFMIHPASRLLWDAVPPLAFLQFPWRFLAVTSFGLAFAAGFLAWLARDRGPVPVALVAVVSVVAVATSWSWFQPSRMHAVDDAVLANERQVARARHGLFDFLPRKVDLEHLVASHPALPAPVHAPDGVRVGRIVHATDRIAFDADVPGDASVRIRVNVFDFPGWRLEVDGRTAPFAPNDGDPLARLYVDLEPGAHRVEARFEDTTVRRVGNAVSAASLLGLLVWTAWVARSR